MSYNLTESQQDLLRWIVEEVETGDLDEEDIWFSWTKDGTHMIGYKGEVPQVKQNTVRAIAQSGLLVCEPKDHGFRCALTSSAREAVESDFEEETGSGSKPSETPPVEEEDYFDKEIWRRCGYVLEAESAEPEACDSAVTAATKLLEERLRKVGKKKEPSHTAGAYDFANAIFGGDGLWREELGEKESQAYRDLYAGAAGIFRNRYAHRFVDPTLKESKAIISFIDLLLKEFGDLKADRDTKGPAE